VRQKACAFYSAVDYIKALRLCTVLMEEIRWAVEVYDVMAVPPSNPAPRLDDDATLSSAASKPAATPEPDTFDLGNMTGIPAIVQPRGFTTVPPVFPVGIQFYGKPFDEATLFRVSHAYESATDWHKRRSPLAGAAAAAKPASQRSVHLTG